MQIRPLFLALAVSAAIGTPAFAAKAAKAAARAPRAAKVTETEVGLDAMDDARKLAEAYLKAIAREGSEEPIESLLGGATLTARIYTIENWRIVGREKHRQEKGRLERLHENVAAIDKAGRIALAMMVTAPSDPDGMQMQELTAEEAARLLEPTRARARSFAKSHPVFAYVARVDKQVYWHPQNPFRPLLERAGKKGDYVVDIDLFWVETIEGAHEDKRPRTWPLRVVRFRANDIDTGLKILPASDWNAE
ncbi:MAG: hypothetical protein ACOX6T_24545 [Myxococcales bacterium]|jgi:hypothetical protein